MVRISLLGATRAGAVSQLNVFSVFYISLVLSIRVNLVIVVIVVAQVGIQAQRLQVLTVRGVHLGVHVVVHLGPIVHEIAEADFLYILW